MNSRVPHEQRSLVRSPLLEVAHLLAHRVARAVNPVDCFQEQELEEVKAALMKCRKGEITSV
eukprot:2997299-Alexandrium_andersonii.AAC.1